MVSKRDLGGAFVFALGVFGCNSGGAGEEMTGVPGEEIEKPDGSGPFFNDVNEAGGASFLRIEEMVWGRLVNVHDVDGNGETNPVAVFRDFVISENVQSDPNRWLLETNQATQTTRLVILRTKGEGTEFVDLLEQASQGLSPILPKGDTPGTLPPFSFIARNAALMIRFNDLLLDDADAVDKLGENVLVRTDYPPTVPFTANRILFDPNHGGLAGDGGSQAFHSTRVIIDMTVSAAEAADDLKLTVNSLGLPASLVTTSQANVAVRIPSQVAPSATQFQVLTNLAGHGVATADHGPVDFDSPTLDVVRAMRSGNAQDASNGFLLDLDQPVLLGGWPVTVDSAIADPGGDAGFDFLVDLTFATPCRAAAQPDDVLQLPGLFLEVEEESGTPDVSGRIAGVAVRSLSDAPVTAVELLGGAVYQRPYEPGVLPAALDGCWLDFTPQPGVHPAEDVSPNSQITLHFSEPMDPSSVLPFDTFLVKRKDAVPTPPDIVVGEIEASADAREFDFTPLLPFSHTVGAVESYHVDLDGGAGGIRDLAGNAPVALPGTVRFELDPLAGTQISGGIVLRFESADELVHPPAAAGRDDLRGQFLYDPDRGLIRPRPVVRSSFLADRSQVIPGLMTAFPAGVQTPLSPLGSKMMTVWRYCDLGLTATDDASYNVDVDGINWSPVGAAVSADFFPEFEMRLAHSRFHPDEALAPSGALATPASGLSKTSFDANVHPDPSAQVIVHEKPKGYLVNPVDLFAAPSGTLLMPYPLNRGPNPDDHVYYTWRDTTIREKGAPFSAGIDPGIMAQAGLSASAGSLAAPGAVPTVGLPLLMEFRCYETPDGVGLNSFDISLAFTGSRQPNFRIFGTGGVNTLQAKVTKDPDLLDVPDGGFNPMFSGAPTPPDDNSFYIGQLDVITRVSRVHTVWIDCQQSEPDFLAPVVEPDPSELPQGTEVRIAWRGATSIGGLSGADYAYDADHIDPYGDVRPDDTSTPPVPIFFGGTADIVFVQPGDASWADDLDAVDGARYLQARITFIGNAETLLSAELSSLGIAFAAGS